MKKYIFALIIFLLPLTSFAALTAPEQQQLTAVQQALATLTTQLAQIQTQLNALIAQINAPVTPPVVTPPISPPPSTPPSIIQWGAFTGTESISQFVSSIGATPQWTMQFTNGFFPSTTGNIVVFLEPPDTDAQILAGRFDAQMTSFAQSAAKYNGKIILALNEEVNCDNVDPWGGSYGSNTPASSISAFQHEENVMKAIARNILFAFSANNASCVGGAPMLSYYPGSSYVDLVALDGFSWSGESPSVVFDSALTQLKTLGKPIWITSMGAQVNQSSWIPQFGAYLKTQPIAGFLWFDYGTFQLNSTGLAAFKSIIP